MRGRVAAGLDNMGGTAANRLTSGGSGITGTTLGATGGAETHTLDVNQIPSHRHDVNDAMPAITSAAGAINRSSSNTADKAAVKTSYTGGGLAHNNTQPTSVLNYIIKT
jgi:microcystin-dependent protein